MSVFLLSAPSFPSSHPFLLLRCACSLTRRLRSHHSLEKMQYLQTVYLKRYRDHDREDSAPDFPGAPMRRARRQSEGLESAHSANLPLRPGQVGARTIGKRAELRPRHAEAEFLLMRLACSDDRERTTSPQPRFTLLLLSSHLPRRRGSDDAAITINYSVDSIVVA